VKEPERGGIQVAFSEMVGSASFPVCMHELCLFCSSAVLCCNDQREEETARERGEKKTNEEYFLDKCTALFFPPLPA